MSHAFLTGDTNHDPRSGKYPSEGRKARLAGTAEEFAEIVADALRRGVCAWCGEVLDLHTRRESSMFCCSQHRYAFRDTKKYALDPEGQRARARVYYETHREQVLERAAARKGKSWTKPARSCEECGAALTGLQRVVCSSRCGEVRYRRLHPDSYAERERRKVERRREKRRQAREGGAS